MSAHDDKITESMHNSLDEIRSKVDELHTQLRSLNDEEIDALGFSILINDVDNKRMRLEAVLGGDRPSLTTVLERMHGHTCETPNTTN